MPHTTREEDEEGHHVRRALLPTLPEILILLIGSFLVLVVLNVLPAVKNNLDGQDYTMFSEFVQSHVERILAPTNNQQGSTVLTIAFWMVVGIISYLLVWIVGSTIAAYRSDVTVSRNIILPQGASKSKVKHEVFLRMLVRLFATIMFFYWLYLLLASIVPYSSGLFLEHLGDLNIRATAMVAWGTIALAASVFMLMIYARCIVLRERVFTS